MSVHWVFRRPTKNVEDEMVNVHGEDTFAKFAETIANGLGTKTFLVFQTVIVVVWIALNLVAVGFQWDPYPFILLNLAFSTQSAYAAPFIIFVGNRQEKRAKIRADIEFENDLRNRVYTEAICNHLGIDVQALEELIQKSLAEIAEKESSANARTKKAD